MAVPPVVSLEIGTSKIRALIGELLENGQIMVTGMGETPSRGVRKGEIIHFEQARTCVKSALEMAEDQSQVAIYGVHLLVTGGHIQSVINHGNVPVLSGEITEHDMDRVMDIARTISLDHDRTEIHTINQHYYVDEQPGMLDPAGMDGAKLALDVLVLHGIRNRMRTATKILKSSHIEVYDLVFGGLCAALAVLSPQQKESGAIVIDMGGGTTDYLVYANQAIACAGSLAVGGDHITNDIALGLRISIAQAERLKIRWGHALCGQALPNQEVPLQAEGGFHGKHIKLSDLHTIIHARVDEIFHLVRSEITRVTPLNMLGAGILLTGGGAHLKGVTELASQLFSLPCHIGMPRNISGLAVATEGPQYAAPLGLIRYAFKTGHHYESEEGFLGAIKRMFTR